MTSAPGTASYLHAAARCLSSRTALVAVSVLLVNDHLLKALAPSWLTGKLSDVAGLYFAPYLALLITLGVVWLAQVPMSLGTGRPPTLLAPVADALTTSVFVALGALFAALKLAPATAGPSLALLELATGSTHAVVVDPGDLLTLVAVPLSYARWRRQLAGDTKEAADRAGPASRAIRTHLARAGRALAIMLAGVATVATGAPVLHSVVGLAVDPSEPGAAYALVRGQSTVGGAPRVVVYRTADAGNMWTLQSRWVDTGGPGRIIPDPALPGRVYLAVPDGVWRLDGSGAALRVWPSPDRPTASGDETAIPPAVAPPWGTGALYVGVTGALVRGGDGGTRWTTLPLPGLVDRPVTALAAGTDDGLLVAAQDRQLWRSHDGGATWERLASLAADPSQLWVHPSRSELLMAAMPTSLLVSDDGGLTWRPTSLEVDPSIPPSTASITFDPGSDAVALAAVAGYGVLRSADAGRSWDRVLATDAFDVVVTPGPTHRVLVAGGRQGVYRQRGWPRWPWVEEWEHANAGLAGQVPTGLAEQLVDVVSSLAVLTGVAVAALLAARMLTPSWLRRAVLAHPWEVALAIWTLYPGWLLLYVLLQDRRFGDLLAASVPALGALVILVKARWSWAVWSLAVLPLVLTIPVLVGVLAIPPLDQTSRLDTLLGAATYALSAAAVLALPAWLLPPRAAKALVIGAGAVIYLPLWAFALVFWPLW